MVLVCRWEGVMVLDCRWDRVMVLVILVWQGSV